MPPSSSSVDWRTPEAIATRSGVPPGDIANSGPTSRFDLEKLAMLRDVVRRYSEDLSRDLGGSA